MFTLDFRNQHNNDVSMRYMQVFFFSLIFTFSQTAFVMAEGLVLCERDTPKGERLNWSTDSIAFSIENKSVRTVKFTRRNYERDKTISYEYSDIIRCNTKTSNKVYRQPYMTVALCVNETKKDDGSLSIVGVSTYQNPFSNGFPFENMPHKGVKINISYFDKNVFQGAITNIEILEGAGHFFNCY